MRYLLVLFLLPIKIALSQPIWHTENNFKIELWETKLSDKEKLEFITNNKFDALSEYFKAIETTAENQIDNFHIGFFNKDKKPDLIYIGYFGTESLSSQIYLGVNDSLKHLVSVGEIQYLEYSEFNIPTIKSHRPPCCADYIHTIMIDSPTSNNTYGKTQRYYFASGTEFPSELTMEQKFSVERPKYHLRRTPFIDNTDNGKYEPTGNISHSYSTGDSGVAYAIKTDSTGRVWWFVEMINPTLEEGEHFPEKNSFFLGWMSSRYLIKNKTTRQH